MNDLMTLAAAGLLVMTVSAQAQTTSVGHGVSESEVVPISESLILINARTMYTDIVSDDMDNPLLNATGPCTGTILINAGAVSGGGYCHYTDASGDQAVVRWDAEGMSAEGRTLGSWSVVGGTGSWMTRTGGGGFDAGTGADGAYTNNISGGFTMN
ncbi:MAG: hypothetical protein ACU0A9_14045 [Alterinioella nitratireducens]|uniref:hypothetical protein n=1 Tax=Alterinioella nitratireducens TaxID=2735915 RepID=UPI0040585D0D